MSLRNRLLVSVLVTLLLSLAAGGAFTYWHALKKIETEMQAAIAVGGRIAHNDVDDIADTSDVARRLGFLVEHFNGDRHLRASLVEGGQVVRTSKLAPPENPAPKWFFDILAGAPKVTKVDLPKRYEHFGHLVLQTDANNEVAEVWSDMWLTLSVLTIFCALVLAFVYWTFLGAIGPLKDLQKAFTRVGERNYGERVDESGPVEMVELCRGFNQMVGRLASAEQNNKRLQEQLSTVQEEERADLARDLHDEIGPLLFAADVDAAAIEQLAQSGAHGQIPERVGIIREAIGRMQRHVRGILGRLRPAMLLDVGLAHAIDNVVSFWRAHRPDLDIRVDVPEEGFGQIIDSAVYRVVQESLSNAIRHGAPHVIEINVHANDDRTISVRVVDDGCGLVANAREGGVGIAGMQERVGSLGGVLKVENRHDSKGVIVSARLPLQARQPVAGAVAEAPGAVQEAIRP